jgi:hypothetical protein
LTRIDFRAGLAALALTASLMTLSACTTVEGTNAMTDIGTFEREVMSETLKGMGMIPREEKPELDGSRRAPLVLPKDGTALPSPTEDTAVAALPEDSGTVQIDASNLTREELRLLRNARVVDLRSVSGRPLTEQEAKQLTARMVMAKNYTGPRPLVLPPDEYFTVTPQGNTLVCLAANGELVRVDDPNCPPEIRRALQGQ